MAITRKTYESRLKKWLTALRSGKYKQTAGKLRGCDGEGDNIYDTYCCLGVACEVFNTNNDCKLPISYTGYGKMANGYSMPTRVIKWLGMTKEGDNDCVDMNDIDRKSFKQIANIIEKNKSKYFIWAQEKEKKSGKATNKKKNS